MCCDALNPGGLFFFWLLDKSVEKENLCRDRIPLSHKRPCRVRGPDPVMCLPKALSPRLYHAHIPVAHACLSCAPGSVVGDRESLLCAVRCLCRARCMPIVGTVAHIVR